MMNQFNNVCWVVLHCISTLKLMIMEKKKKRSLVQAEMQDKNRQCYAAQK